MSLFTEVHFTVPKSHGFRRTRENHLSCQMGELVPFLTEEIYPADIFKINTEASIKLAPLRAPSMTRMDAYMHFFFIPDRLLYTNWENFITGGTKGNIVSVKTFTDPSNPSPLEAVSPNFDFAKLFTKGVLLNGSLQDYLGLPTPNSSRGFTPPQNGGTAPSDIPPINALPWLAYWKVFSDWYRDELLDPYEFEPFGDGEIDISSGTPGEALLQKAYRCWKKDYFTSARNDTQLGAPASVPISGTIIGDDTLRLSTYNAITQNTNLNIIKSSEEQDADTGRYSYATNAAGTQNVRYASGLSLDEAGILINDLRRTLRLQEWGEKNMRGGNRYIENIFHHFGVKSSDARLQRSQYLGGKKIPVVIGEVLQSVGQTGSSATIDNENAVGVRGGVGAAGGSSQIIRFRSEEHGFILGIVSIMPHTSYFQGIPRYLADRWDRFSYAWPEFSNLGEQEVYNWELFVTNGANNGGVFGYQSRYADLKTGTSEIHGEFRDSLAFWHQARIFSSRPNLNNGFVNFGSASNANGMNRIFAVEANNLASHFYCHFFNHVKLVRRLSKYGTPSI